MKIIAVVALIILTSSAFALIPPTPKDELVKLSSLIIVGKVIGTVLVNIDNDGRWETKTYQSWVIVQKTLKGRVKPNRTIIVEWHDYTYVGKERNIVGGPSDISAYPGTIIKLYLQMDKNTGEYYAAGEWNSVEPIKTFKVVDLPNKVGEWVFVRGE